MYNHTGLQGRLTADPELRYTQQGTAITSFTLASDTGRKTKGKPKKLTDAERAAEIAKLEQEMKEASKLLEFEYAAVLRDRIIELRGGK